MTDPSPPDALPPHDPLADTTTETLLGGALHVCQARRGYRFSIDAMLLGAGSVELPGDRILDAGAGVGVVGLVAAALRPQSQVVGVELQQAQAARARANAARNGLNTRYTLIEGDLRDLTSARPEPLASPFDLALLNPPYHPAGSGRINPNSERAVSRHELNGTLTELARACRLLMAPRAVLRIIYPAEALPRLLSAVQDAGLKPQRLRPIQTASDTPARLVLLDAGTHGRRALTLAPALVLYDAPSRYTPTVARLLRGERVGL